MPAWVPHILQRRGETPTIATLTGALAVAALGVSCIEQLRILSLLAARYTHEDHAVLWCAARDFGRFQMREPTYYGQNYGVIFEAVPAALLHAFGMSYGSAFPAGLVLMGLASWWACAWAAWSRGWFVAAFSAAAAPILLSTEHSLVVSVYATGAGRCVAALGAAVLWSHGQRMRGAATSVGLCTFAVAMDAAAALIAVPALVWGVCHLWYRRRYWLPVALGGLPGLGWLALCAAYSARHPDHAIHAGTAFDPSWSVLQTNMQQPAALLAIHAPQLFMSAYFVLGMMLLCLLLVIAARAWAELLALTSFIVLLALLASLWKSFDGLDTIWFRVARLTLPVPLGLWFCCVISVRAALARASRVDQRVWPAAVSVIAVMTAGTAAARAYDLRDQLERLASQGAADNRYPVRTVEQVRGICRDVKRSAADAGTNVVIFADDERSASFACHALYPELITAFPTYERRSWVLHDLMERRATSMLLWNAPAKRCSQQRWRAALTGCGPASAGDGLSLRFEPRSPLRVLHAIGITPRPFGDDCHPGQPATCQWWAHEFGQQP